MKTPTLVAGAAILVVLATSLFVWPEPARTLAEPVRVLPPSAAPHAEAAASASQDISRPVPVPAPSSPPSRPKAIAFGEQEDMWRFAKLAEASQDVPFKFEGYSGAMQCQGLLLAREAYSEKIDEALRAGDTAPYLALTALTKRCAGFSSAGPQESEKLVESLKAQILASKSGLTPLAEERPLNDQERQAALLSGSPTAIEMALPGVQGVNGLAITLAMCDLGRPCGADSYIAHTICVLSGQCNQAPWADVQNQFDSLEWQEIQRDREFLVRAVRTGEVQGLFKRRR